MKPIFFLRNFIICLLGTLIAFSGNASPLTPPDTIKPLPQVNKTFQVVAQIVYNEDTLAGQGIDSASIAAQLSLVNILFAPIGVSFSLCKVNYIYNFQYDVIDDTKNRADLLTNFWLPNRINMFFVSGLGGTMAAECGNADFGGITSTQPVGILLKKDPKCQSPYVYAHELGHYFGLSHTFDISNGLELVDGSNCSTAGDQLCDTPADPYDVNNNVPYIDNNCSFIYTGKDANGQYYSPDVGNIMSYYTTCACRFSRQQYEKMAKYYLSNPIEW